MACVHSYVFKNLPQPVKARARKPYVYSSRRYPFAIMDVGHSFIVTVFEDETIEQVIARLRSASRYYVMKDRSNCFKQFKIHKLNATQVGVWRVN